ncbi:MAG TPA: amidase family protein, partial [Steroidobacteraceae bacterium]|nr:amidase family protein [Steroidobacteraceae bacterium]
LEYLAVRGLRLLVPQTLVLDGLDDPVARGFQRALGTLSRAGAQITEAPLSELRELAQINRLGGFSAAEAYALHRGRLETSAAQYDPRVSVRILRGREQSAADYIDLVHARTAFQARINAQLAPFDAVVMPATPIIAPTLAELASDAEYGRLNLLALRNPSVANFLDRCALSLPCHEPGTAPVGLMLMGPNGADRRLLAIGAAVEELLQQ